MNFHKFPKICRRPLSENPCNQKNQTVRETRVIITIVMFSNQPINQTETTGPEKQPDPLFAQGSSLVNPIQAGFFPKKMLSVVGSWASAARPSDKPDGTPWGTIPGVCDHPRNGSCNLIPNPNTKS